LSCHPHIGKPHPKQDATSQTLSEEENWSGEEHHISSDQAPVLAYAAAPPCTTEAQLVRSAYQGEHGCTEEAWEEFTRAEPRHPNHKKAGSTHNCPPQAAKQQPNARHARERTHEPKDVHVQSKRVQKCRRCTDVLEKKA